MTHAESSAQLSRRLTEELVRMLEEGPTRDLGIRAATFFVELHARAVEALMASGAMPGVASDRAEAERAATELATAVLASVQGAGSAMITALAMVGSRNSTRH